MDCCRADIIESRFDHDYVEKKLKRYRRRGPKRTTIILADAIKAQMRDGMTLLDIGGGIGDVQHLLLPQGISQAINCEASSAFLDVCKQEATKGGYAERIQHIQGDFVEIADRVPKADVVTLDRVICCYPDMAGLVKASLDKTGSYYGIVVPHDHWFIKAITSLYYNVRFLLQKNPFRVFVHPVQAITAQIESEGFQRIFMRRSAGWEIHLFSRNGL